MAAVRAVRTWSNRKFFSVVGDMGASFATLNAPCEPFPVGTLVAHRSFPDGMTIGPSLDPSTALVLARRTWR
jgi:hypothetical protein